MNEHTVEIEELRIDQGSRTTVWKASGIELRNPESSRLREGEETAIAIFLDVDGNIDQVYGDLGLSGDVESLDRAIMALQHVRDALSAIETAIPRRAGRCFAQGGYGRCRYDSGHDEPHRFPAPDHEADSAAILKAMTESWEGSPVA